MSKNITATIKAYFTQAATRTNLTTGENIETSFGKIVKWFSDLKALAFKDKVDTTDLNFTSLPANGGNADTVGSRSWYKTSDAFVTNTGDVAGIWTVTIPDITELYDGLTIRIKLSTSYNSNMNTLNVNGLGAKLVWWRYNNRFTTHVPQYSEIYLTYRTAAGSYTNDITYTDGWIMSAAYDSGNTWNTLYYSENIKLGQAIYGYDLLMKSTDDMWYPLTVKTTDAATSATTGNSTIPLLIGSEILTFASSADMASGSVLATSNIRSSYAANIKYPLYGTFTQYSDVYLVGTVVNGYFYMSATGYWTHTLPTIDDGKVYIYLGYMSTTTIIRITLQHPIYWYKNGSLRLYPDTGATGGGTVDVESATEAEINAVFEV